MDFGIFTSISKNYLPVFVTLLINESFWGDFNQIEDGWLCRFQMILMQLPPALRYPTPVPFSTLHVHYPFHTYRRLGLKYHHYSTILWVSVQANRAFLLNISVASTPEWKVLNTLWIQNRVGRLIRILLLLLFFFIQWQDRTEFFTVNIQDGPERRVIASRCRPWQTSEKLQCLYENLMSNNFCKTAVLKKISIVN